MNIVQLTAAAIAFAFSLFFHSIGYSKSETAMLYVLAGPMIIAIYIVIVIVVSIFLFRKSNLKLPFIMICSLIMIVPWSFITSEYIPRQEPSKVNFLEIKKFATSGNVKSQYELAKIYYYGTGFKYSSENGVAQDYQKALVLAIIAKENGKIDNSGDFIKSEDYYEFQEIWNQLMFYGSLSKAEISEAQQLAKTCLSDGYRDCE